MNKLYRNKHIDTIESQEYTQVYYAVAKTNPNSDIWECLPAQNKDANKYISGNELEINPLGRKLKQLYIQDGVRYYGVL